ncbi:nucleolin isoform X1 [Amborella trichopoda]|uniref:nucleolin isoform X1 n=1 Tax=Amborella trichopoda TaxID=13333 RepID=UPI0005D3CDC1|nr:nucleolin isoform X1 [Amborella trichopoda]|eukprot:XP_006851846.2 nucleolin isoform X1 [Amborella trichopoda]
MPPRGKRGGSARKTTPRTKKAQAKDVKEEPVIEPAIVDVEPVIEPATVDVEPVIEPAIVDVEPVIEPAIVDVDKASETEVPMASSSPTNVTEPEVLIVASSPQKVTEPDVSVVSSSPQKTSETEVPTVPSSLKDSETASVLESPEHEKVPESDNGLGDVVMEKEEEPEIQEEDGEAKEHKAESMDFDQGVSHAEQDAVEENTAGNVADTTDMHEDSDGPAEADEGVEGGEDANPSESDNEEEEPMEENVEGEDPSLYMEASLSERKKEKEFEIFIGGLDKEVVEEDLIKVFGEFGEIEHVRLLKNPTTKKNKGFAFIRYATVEQARKALAELKEPEVRGKRCGISASQDNDTLYVGNICKTWTKDKVLETLKSLGVEQIEEMLIPDDPKSEGKSRGFAFLEFSTHSDAIAAFQILRKPNAVFGCDRSAKVSFAQCSMHPSEEALSQVKTVYVEGLPNSWDEAKIKDLCKQYGDIEKVQLSKNFTTSKRKDFGFVTFVSRESALNCVEGLNKAELGEGETKIKANLAKPLNKGRLAKQGARGGFRLKKDGENIGQGPGEPSGSKLKGMNSQGRFKAKGQLKSKGAKGKLHEAKPADKHPNRGQIAQQGKRNRRDQEIDNRRPPKRTRNDRSNYGNVHGFPTRNMAIERNYRPARPIEYPPSYAYREPYAADYSSRYLALDPRGGYVSSSIGQGQASYGAAGYGGQPSSSAYAYGYGGGTLPPSYAEYREGAYGYSRGGYLSRGSRPYY